MHRHSAARRLGVSCTLLVVAGACLLHALATRAVSANPNQQAVAEILTAHGFANSTALHAQAAKILDQVTRELDNYSDALEKNRIDRFAPQNVTRTIVSIGQLERLALQLLILGEPAGFELRQRCAMLRRNWKQFSIKYRGVPAALKYNNTARLNFQRTAASRQKELDKIAELIDKQQWSEAEKRQWALWDAWKLQSGLLTEIEEGELLTPVTPLRHQIERATEPLRRRAAVEVLLQRRNQEIPNHAAWLGRVQQAASDLANAPQVELDGAQHTGPAALQILVHEWSAIERAEMRARAVEWARLTALGAATSEDLEGWAHACSGFAEQASAALTQLIRADAQRANAADVAALYHEYLAVLGPATARGAESVRDIWEEPLQQLAARSPELTAEIEAYRTATSDLMRWKRRAAAQSAQGAKGKAPDAHILVQNTFQSADGYQGLYAQNSSNLNAPEFVGSAPEILERLPQVIGQVVTLPATRRLKAEGELAVSTYTSRTYATMKLPLTPEVKEVAEHDLLARDNNAVLTLEAARILAGVENGWCVAAGGEIQGVHLEGLITRFGILPDAAWALTELGQIAIESIPPSSKWEHQAVVRFDMVPQWLQFETQFVPVR